MQTATTDKIAELAGLAFVHRKGAVISFAIIGILVLIAAWYMPRQFSSFATVLNDPSEITEPLLRGSAVPTSVVDRAKTAGELIFSRTILAEALAIGQWLDADATPLEKETYIESVLKRRIEITTGVGNLVRVQFTDTNPELAQQIAQFLATTYVDESRRLQMEESETAFEFLDTQVEEYHDKLLEAEAGLERFNSDNIDTQPGTENMVIERITSLRAQNEATNTELIETIARRDVLRDQLGGEAATTESISKESALLGRIAENEQQLSELRLLYHDSYPDIVQLKSQIAQMEERITNERSNREGLGAGSVLATPSTVDVRSSSGLTDVYGELRREVQDADGNIAVLSARLSEGEKQLAAALEKGRQVQATEAMLAELTRNYEVNRSVHADLLQRRENARVSMNLDQRQQGQNARIYEAAFLPQKPSGLRFSHYLGLGIFFGVAIPAVFLLIISFLDSRYRQPDLLAQNYEMPVLMTIPSMAGTKFQQGFSIEKALLTSIVAFVLLLYVLSTIARLNGIDITNWL